MFRADYLRFVWAAVVLIWAAGVWAAESDRPQPHVVFFLADDLGWKDVGFHGSEIRTPHLDQLARGGVRLEQFYVQPVCSPTRSSLMTGRYPIRQGLQVGVIRPWATYGLPLEERTLATALGEAGYTTAIAGKWHLGLHAPEYLPTRRGFDLQYGHYTGALDYFTHRRMEGLDWHRNGQPLEEPGYTTTLIGQEAAKIVREHDVSAPLFLYVPFNAPHGPLQAPPEAIEAYAEIKNRKRRVYAAMVSLMDEAIGQVVAALDERRMRDKTLILFASDNGGPVRLGANNGPLKGGKGTLYEGGVRVPALANWPGQLPAGETRQQLLHIVDWYPTLIQLVGGSLQQPLPLDGYDARATIARGEPSPRTELLHNVTPSRGAVRVGPWKLVVHYDESGQVAGRELFQVERDPSEKEELSARHPEQADRLLARLESYRQGAEPPKGGVGRQPKGFRAPRVWGHTD